MQRTQRTHARTHARTHPHELTQVHIYTHAAHARTHTHTSRARTHALAHTHALARTHARTHAHTHRRRRGRPASPPAPTAPPRSPTACCARPRHVPVTSLRFSVTYRSRPSVSVTPRSRPSVSITSRSRLSASVTSRSRPMVTSPGRGGWSLCPCSPTARRARPRHVPRRLGHDPPHIRIASSESVTSHPVLITSRAFIAFRHVHSSPLSARQESAT